MKSDFSLFQELPGNPQAHLPKPQTVSPPGPSRQPGKVVSMAEKQWASGSGSETPQKPEA